MKNQSFIKPARLTYMSQPTPGSSGPNKKQPATIEELRQQLANTAWSKLADLNVSNKLSNEVLFALNEVIDSNPNQDSPFMMLLEIIRDEKLKDQSFSSEFFPTESIIQILIKELKNQRSKSSDIAGELIINISSNFVEASRKTLKEFVDHCNNKILELQENRQKTSDSTNQAIQFAKQRKGLNWEPEAVSEEQYAQFQERMDELLQKYNEVESLYPIYMNASPEQEAQLDIQLDKLEKEIKDIEGEIPKILPNFKREFKSLLSFQEAFQQTGIDFLNTTELKLKNGKIINIESVEANGENICIQYIDEDEKLWTRNLNQFIKNVIEAQGAHINIPNIHGLNEALNTSEDPIKPGDRFIAHNPKVNKDGEVEWEKKFFTIKKIDDSVENGEITFKETSFDDKNEEKEEEKTLNFGEFVAYKNKNRFNRDSENSIPETEPDPKDIERFVNNIPDEVKNKLFNVLPFEDVQKIGDVGYKVEQPSYLKILYENTYVYSPKNFFQFFKHIWEYIKKQWELADDIRVGKLGEQTTGGLKESFKYNKRKAAQKEKSEMRRKILESKELSDLVGLLRTSQDKVDLEICFDILSEKGMLDLWDLEMWKNISKHSHHQYTIPIPKNNDPNTLLGEDKPYRGYEILRKALDQMFDPGTMAKWENANWSNYSQKVKAAEDKAASLRNIESGYRKVLSYNLKNHREGDSNVDPHEYEGILSYMMENKVGTLEEQIYYLIQGVTVKNKKTGKPLMPFERITQLRKSLGSKFPPLIFLTSNIERETQDPNIKRKHPFTITDFEAWSKEFEKADGPANEPNEAVKKYIWENIVTHPEFKGLANESVRNINSLESSDIPYYLPLADANTVQNSCSLMGGQKNGPDAYASGFAGYPKYLNTLLKKKNVNVSNISESLQAFVRYWAIMTNRLGNSHSGGGDRLQRLEPAFLKRYEISEDPKLSAQDIIDELLEALEDIALSYRSTKPDLYNLLIEMRKPVPDNKTKSQAMQKVLDKFNRTFEEMIESDNGEKFIQTLKSANLTDNF